MSQQSARIIKFYLTSNSITVKEFARKTHLSHTSIHKFLNGTNIHPISARKIEKYTRGAISSKDLLS